MTPRNRIRSSQVTFLAQFDGHEFWIAMTTHNKDHAVVRDGHRNNIGAQTGRFPNDLSSARVITSNPVGRTNDDFGPAVVLDCQRRTPRTRLVARRAPQLFAVTLVDRNDERSRFVIENYEQLIAQQQRCSAFAKREPHFHLHTEVFFPDQFSVEVVSIQAARTERCVDVPAVSDWRVRSKAAVRSMVTFVRCRGFRRLLPQNLARLAIETEQFETMLD